MGVSEYVEENKIKEEDAIADVVDMMCSVKKKEGRWVSKYDITRDDDDSPLKLVGKETMGYCHSECMAIQRACVASLKSKEDVIIPLLVSRKGPEELKKVMCKKICDKKKLPALKGWVDQEWKPRDTKELEAEERVAKMEAESGQKYQMWSREQIASMSQADIELEAAKDALGAARREAK